MNTETNEQEHNHNKECTCEGGTCTCKSGGTCTCEGGKCTCDNDNSHNCEGGSCKAGKCECKHHRAIPSMIVGIGVVALLGALGALSGATVAIIWPILLIGIGTMKMTGRKCGCC